MILCDEHPCRCAQYQAVVDAARAWVEQDFGNEAEYAAVVRALIDAVHALDSEEDR